jgi:hypothetical protein
MKLLFNILILPFSITFSVYIILNSSIYWVEKHPIKGVIIGVIVGVVIGGSGVKLIKRQ